MDATSEESGSVLSQWNCGGYRSIFGGVCRHSHLWKVDSKGNGSTACGKKFVAAGVTAADACAWGRGLPTCSGCIDYLDAAMTGTADAPAAG